MTSPHRLTITVLAALAFSLVRPITAAAGESNDRQVSFATSDKTLSGPLNGHIYEPVGTGPFPAVVLLHTCAGIHAFNADWAEWLAQHGYVALVVDSFAGRQVTSVCNAGGDPNPRRRAMDAYDGLAYLRSLPEVDGKRVAVMGWSHGGSAAFVAAAKGFVDELSPPGGPFRAAIGLYPNCHPIKAVALSAPLLVLLGGQDVWQPAENCQEAVNRLAKNGIEATVQVFPSAGHGFDDSHAAQGKSHTVYSTVYDADAAADTHQRVLAYLQEKMR